MTKSKIAILGPVGISIPPKKQGGIEWMVYYLVEGLAKKGYQVLLFAPKGTKTSAKLIPVCQKPMEEYKLSSEAEASRKLRLELSILANTLSELIKRRGKIGLVLNHMVDGGIFTNLEKLLKIPVFHTLHLPIYQELAEVYKKTDARLITISDNQRKNFPALNYATTIYNGIDLKNFDFSKKPKNYFLFAGKIRPSKNPLDAIKAVKKSGEKLLLIGKISDERYFKSKIKPLLSKNITYLGEVSVLKIKQIYAGAKALLFPIKWQEPFGLVMIEAMASGAPVIAYPAGAVPEVVKDKETGFIVKNLNEMEKAIKNIDKIDRRRCRERVGKYFSAEKMVDDYEKIIKRHLK